MNYKDIIYCTQVYFLDTAIEYVKLLSNIGYNVHVIIEISPKQLNANILSIDTDLSQYATLTSFNEIKNDWHLNFLEPYFKNCKSVNFAVFPTKKSSANSKSI